MSTPETGSMGGASHNKSMTFNNPAASASGSSVKEELAKKMKALEAEKEEMQKKLKEKDEKQAAHPITA